MYCHFSKKGLYLFCGPLWQHREQEENVHMDAGSRKTCAKQSSSIFNLQEQEEFPEQGRQYSTLWPHLSAESQQEIHEGMASPQVMENFHNIMPTTSSRKQNNSNLYNPLKVCFKFFKDFSLSSNKEIPVYNNNTGHCSLIQYIMGDAEQKRVKLRNMSKFLLPLEFSPSSTVFILS